MKVGLMMIRDWEVDEWLSAFDFDQSPLGAFESIMADPSTGYQV